MAKVHLLAALLTIAVLAGFLSTANGQGGGRPYPPREQNRDCRYVCYYDHCSGNRCYYTCSRHRLCEEQGNVLLEAQQVNGQFFNFLFTLSAHGNVTSNKNLLTLAQS